METKFTVSGVISQGWELTKKNWLALLGMVVGCYIAVYILSLLFGPGLDIFTILAAAQSGNIVSVVTASIGSIIKTYIVTTILNILLYCGIYQFLLDCGRGKGAFSMDLWKRPLSNYLQYCLTSLLVSLLVSIGTSLCIVPGIFIGVRLQFATYYVLDHKDVNCIDAIKASWNMTDSHTMDLFLVALAYILIGFVGSLLCCVGYVPAIMVIQFSVVACYLTLHPSASTEVKTEEIASKSSVKKNGLDKE